MARRKRKLEETDMWGFTKRQRQRLSENPVGFQFGPDNNDYLDILDCIKQSSLIKKLNIPLNINSEIAIYSTGQIHVCAKKKCDNEILIMQKDIRINENQDNFDKYIRLSKNTYWCRSCRKTKVKCKECNQKMKIIESTCVAAKCLTVGMGGFTCQVCGYCERCESQLCPHEECDYCLEMEENEEENDELGIFGRP